MIQKNKNVKEIDNKKEEIRQKLIQFQEEDYKKFSSSLIPGSKPLLGVRIPILRKLAKEKIGRAHV